MVSILGEYYYDFPRKIKLEKRLKDLLEDSVDEKFYLSDDKIERVSNWGGYENPFSDIERDRICSTITTHCGKDSNGMQLVKEEKDCHFHVWLMPRHKWMIEKFGNVLKNIKAIQNYSFENLRTKENIDKIANTCELLKRELNK